MSDVLTAGLELAAGVLRLIPDPDPVVARAQYTRGLAELVARLEARQRKKKALTPQQEGRLAGAKAALIALSLSTDA